MLSLETAKRLKEAGLKWEMQLWDLAYDVKNHTKSIVGYETLDDLKKASRRKIERGKENLIFIPRLDQLLAEIEKRGYGWKLEKFHAYNLRRMEIYKVNDLLGCFEGNSPEEAAAQALIWILEQEVKSDEI